MKRTSKEQATRYATGSDFYRIFNDDMQSLYLLALVLTADPQKAEQCFVAGLGDCTSGNQVFKEWARSWTRRVVIKNAIRSIAPGMAPDNPTLGVDKVELPAGLGELNLPAEISALLQLPPHERFAFVMSFCEGYSDQDSALLLGCTRETMVAARVAALQLLKDFPAAMRDLQAEAATTAGNDRHPDIGVALSARLATVA